MFKPSISENRVLTVIRQDHHAIINVMKRDASDYEAESDEALMLAYGMGDYHAFEMVYSRHKNPIYRYILRQGIRESVAEELVQDIWSKVIANRASYQVTAKFSTWLYRIARNRLIDHFRVNKEFMQLIEDDNPTSELDIPDNRDEQFAMIRKTISRLPFPQRQALLLHYEAGMTVKEVADVTREHPEAVKSSIRYAVKKLSQLMRPDDAGR